MTIYKITNLITGKIYIGQTINSLKYRFSHHCCVISTYVGRSIKKYGKENFKIESVVRCESLKELNIREESIIRIYNSLQPNGYNIARGGNNRGRTISPMQGKKHSEKTKKKMSIAAKGKSKSFEAVKRMAAAKKGCTWTEEHKRNFKNTRIGMTKLGRVVVSKEYNKEFKSVTEASKELSIPRRTICRWLKSRININIISYK